MPYLEPAKRASDPAGNRQYATHPLWCWQCVPGVKTRVGDYRKDRLNTAAHDHIDRTHPTQEEVSR